MQKKAKYNENVLSISMKQDFYIEKDDMDLKGNYLSHTAESFRSRAHILSISEILCCCHCYKLPNSMLASLPMHCFYCKLTSAIAQALLQAALDKESSDLHGWSLQYEFLSLASVRSMMKHSNSSCNARRMATIKSGTGIPG
jgi:hypothetical protein